MRVTGLGLPTKEPIGFRHIMMARGTSRVTGTGSGAELNTTIIGIMIVIGIFTNTPNTNMITATGTVTVTVTTRERITRTLAAPNRCYLTSK
jgi:hypothetical protein